MWNRFVLSAVSNSRHVRGCWLAEILVRCTLLVPNATCVSRSQDSIRYSQWSVETEPPNTPREPSKRFQIFQTRLSCIARLPAKCAQSAAGSARYTAVQSDFSLGTLRYPATRKGQPTTSDVVSKSEELGSSVRPTHARGNRMLSCLS
jgi:hypothetical protein